MTVIPRARAQVRKPFQLASDLNGLRQQRGQLNKQMAQPGANQQQIQRQLGRVRQGILSARNAQTPTTGPGLQEQPQAPTQPVPPQQPDPNATAALFPGYESMLPKSFEEDPIYQFNMAQGNKELNRRLSANGLLNSGAEIEAANDLLSRVNADTAQRYTNIAQNEADRLERIQQNEATRQQRDREFQVDSQLRMIQQLLSQNPMEYAYDATKKTGDLTLDQAKNNANYLSNAYRRVHAARSPGPGPQAPQLPDYSGINMLQALGGNNNSNNWLNMISGGLGTLGRIFG